MRVQAGSISGREVLGAQDRGLDRNRHARLGQSGKFGDHAVPDVLEVGDPFGHQAAHLGEHLDELGGRIGSGTHGRLTGFDGVLGRSQPGPVLGQLRGGAQHLRRRAGRRRGPVAQALSHRGGGVGEPGGFGRPIQLGQHGA